MTARFLSSSSGPGRASASPPLTLGEEEEEEEGRGRSCFGFLLMSGSCLVSPFGFWRRGGGGETLVQRFASFSFLVQAALAALHHVNKVGQRLLLVHRNIPEVTTHRLTKKPVKIKVSVFTSTLESLILKSSH